MSKSDSNTTQRVSVLVARVGGRCTCAGWPTIPTVSDTRAGAVPGTLRSGTPGACPECGGTGLR